MQPPEPCPSCGESTCSRGFVALWDGREYCVDCVERASPRLLERARSEKALEETFSYPMPKLAALWGSMFIAATGGFVFTVILGAWISGEFTLFEAVKYWAIGMGFSMPLMALYTLATTAGCAFGRPTVKVEAGALTVLQRGKTDSVALSECEWYAGKVSHMTILDNATIIQAPAVILVLPPADEKSPDRKVAVGLTDPEREIWEAFLTVTRVPQRADWGVKSRIPSFVKYIGWFLMIPVGFFGFAFLGGGVMILLSLVVPDQGLCQIVGTMVFVLGLISAVGYAAILGPWHTTRRVPTKRTPAEQRKQQQLLFLKFFALTTVMIVLPLFVEMQNLSLLAKTVAIALAYGWVAVMSLHYGRLVTQYDWEFARPAEPRGADESPPS